jgi:hypothetical protein
VQPLTAPPRAAFTTAQVTAALTADAVKSSFGVELLSPSLALIEDISGDVAHDGPVVKHDNTADIHGTCELTISRALKWGYDRVRPYTVSNGIRWNQGVFVLTSPQRQIGETPEAHAAVGYDQLYLLADNIGDSVAVLAGANVLNTVRSVLTEAGILAPVLLDTAGASKVLAEAKVWPLTSSESPTWIQVANDLLKSIGYRELWCDWDGALRSGPYVLPELRASESRLDVGNLKTGIVAGPRAVANDVFGLPNWMRVIANRGSATALPTEGDGRYTMTNPDRGPSSVAAVGLRRAPVVFLDAVSQADLVVQGDRLFAAATRSSEVLTFRMSQFPLWHFDRLEYDDAALGALRQIQVRSWSLPLDGGDMDVVAETVQ